MNNAHYHLLHDYTQFLIPYRDVPLLVVTLPIKSNQKRMHVIDLGQIVYKNKD